MMDKLGVSVLFLIAAFMLFASIVPGAYAQDDDSKKGNICKGEYVLCTSAPCVPDPTNPDTKSICECDVNIGKNFGFSECEERKPGKNKDGTIALISTYSFAQAPTKPVMICPSGKPWSNCLDQPCTVKPLDPLHAYCYCDIERTSTFVTFGANCNGITCNTGFWSGATIEQFVKASKQLTESFGMKENPTRYCPGLKP